MTRARTDWITLGHHVLLVARIARGEDVSQVMAEAGDLAPKVERLARTLREIQEGRQGNR